MIPTPLGAPFSTARRASPSVASSRRVSRSPITARPPVLAAVALLAVVGCRAPDADDAGGAGDDLGRVPQAGYDATAMADDLGRQLEILGQKMVDLARAMPEGTYDWAPMEGVRSVGAVYAHVAGDNYFVPALVGMPVDGTGVTVDSGIRAYEEARGTKAEIVAELERSFAAMDEALAATRMDLGTEISLRGNAIPTGELWVRAITHLHEHLGQAIAYARANGVVPPWSAAG